MSISSEFRAFSAEATSLGNNNLPARPLMPVLLKGNFGSKPAKDHTAISESWGRYECRTLENGLRVHLFNSGEPIVGVGVTNVMLHFRIGAANERADQAGVAHMVEHLAARRVDAILRGAYDAGFKPAEMFGKNAYTAMASTNYSVDVPTGRENFALKALSEALRFNSVSAKELNLEKRIVLCENAHLEAERNRVDWETTVALLAPKDRVGQSVTGSKEQLLAMTPAHVEEFTRTNYRPANCELLVCGRLTTSIESLIEEHFAGIPGQLSDRSNPLSPVQLANGDRVTVIPRQQIGATAIIYKSMRQLELKETATYDLLSRLVAGGPSPFWAMGLEQTREVEGLVYALILGRSLCSAMTPLLMRCTTDESENTAQVVKSLLSTLNRCSKGEIDPRLLEVVREQTLQSVRQPNVSACAFFIDALNSMVMPDQYAEELRRITKNDIATLAREIFDRKDLRLLLLGEIPNQELEKCRKLFTGDKNGGRRSSISGTKNAQK